jgi:outer membrane protein W
MGNAMSAVTEGNLVSYYNPALSVFQENNSFQTSYSFLSLDRSLNFLNFTRRFDFYSSKDTSKEKGEPRSTAGVSIGIINAGVGNIDGRDNQGIHTEELSTSENQFFLGLGVKLSRKLALGLNAKFYYYKLYEDVSSSGVGLDIGALYTLNEEWNISLVITDLNSKYDWETNSIYGQDGTSTKDKFPLLKKIGVSYHNEGSDVIAAAEFENSNAGTNIIKVGIEYNIYENLFVRGGVDKFNLSNTDATAKPALGFSYSENFGSLVIGVDYAFMIEQYSPHDRHIVGVNVNF